MSAIGRWGTPDPLAGMFPSLSPYNYVAGNPTGLTDPTGLAPFPGASNPIETESTCLGYSCLDNLSRDFDPGKALHPLPDYWASGDGDCPECAFEVEMEEATVTAEREYSGARNLTFGNPLIGGGMTLDQIGGFGNVNRVWQRSSSMSDMLNPSYLSRTRVTLERLVGRNMSVARKYAGYASNLGRASTAVGLAFTAMEVVESPHYIGTLDFTINVGAGVGVALLGPVGAGVVTVGYLGYTGTNWYCGGESGGFCGYFNYVTETPFSQIYKNLR